MNHNAVLHPSSRSDAANVLNILFGHWIIKIGIPDILLTENGNEFINFDFAHFCHIYNVQFKPRIPYSPWWNKLVEMVIDHWIRFLAQFYIHNMTHGIIIYKSDFSFKQLRKNMWIMDGLCNIMDFSILKFYFKPFIQIPIQDPLNPPLTIAKGLIGYAQPDISLINLQTTRYRINELTKSMDA